MAVDLYWGRGDIRQMNGVRVDVEGGELSGSVKFPDDAPATFTDLWADQTTVKAKGKELVAQTLMDSGDWMAAGPLWREAAALYATPHVEPLVVRCRLLAACASVLAGRTAATPDTAVLLLRAGLDSCWRDFREAEGSQLYRLAYWARSVRPARRELRRLRA